MHVINWNHIHREEDPMLAVFYIAPTQFK